jgi:dihydrodipicolinate synthase/N-acetylneuraminate lyase
VPVDLLASLPVAGQKDSSGDPERLLDELAHYSGATYVGSSSVLAMAGPMGATGALLALANVEPERCVAAFAGDAAAQRGLADRHLALSRGGVLALKQLLAEERSQPVPARIG